MPQEPCIKIVTIENNKGLHARAAAKLVATADNFDATVEICAHEQVVSGHSIMGLLMLGANQGSKLQVQATGLEANAAVEAICDLISLKFDED